MALQWTDKQNNVDIIDAEDINDLAHAITALENTEPTVDQTYSATSTNAQSGVAVAQAISQSITQALNTGV